MSLRAALLALTCLAQACTPTLSKPRGDAHLDAMARAGRHYHHGRMLEAAEAYGVAADAAERRVDRDEARYRQAKALQRAGQVERALALLDDVARARPPSRRTVRALYDASRQRLARGESAGLAGMRRLVTEHPGHGLARSALRAVLADYEARGDHEGAVAFTRAMYRSARDTELGDNLLWYEARHAAARGRVDEERRVLRRLVAEHPYPHGQLWDQALVRLADLAEQAGDAAEAIRLLEEMLSVHEHTSPPGTYTLPTFPESQLRVARLYRDALADRAAAEAAFRKLVSEFPHSTLRDDALTELGEMLLANGDVRGACDVLRDVVRQFEVGRARRRAAGLVQERCSER